MAGVTIQPASATTDFNAIRQLYWQTWQAAYQGQVPAAILSRLTPAVWHPEKRWRGTQLAVNAAGKIIGVCSYGPARLALLAGWGELYSIYILPDYQHQGIGQRLIHPALVSLKRQYRRLYLEVLATNKAAQAFYVQMGFHQTIIKHVSDVPGGKLTTIICESK